MTRYILFPKKPFLDMNILYVSLKTQLTPDFKIIVVQNILRISPHHVILMDKTKKGDMFPSLSKPGTSKYC